MNRFRVCSPSAVLLSAEWRTARLFLQPRQRLDR